MIFQLFYNCNTGTLIGKLHKKLLRVSYCFYMFIQSMFTVWCAIARVNALLAIKMQKILQSQFSFTSLYSNIKFLACTKDELIAQGILQNERRRVKKLCRVIEKEGEILYKKYQVQLRKKRVKSTINSNKTGVQG